IKAALNNAHKHRDQLHAQLKNPGGVFELLNKPDNWEGMITSARAELQRAKDTQMIADGIDPQLLEQIVQLDRLLVADAADRALPLKLEKIREDKAVIVESRLSLVGAKDRYRKAFADAGLEPMSGHEQVIAECIAKSAIGDYLVAALDDWASLGGPTASVILA